MKQYKYKTIFSSRIKPLVSEEVDKYISLASNNFKYLFPNEIDFDKKIDFLGIYGNLCVVNRLNANEDGITNEEALAIADSVPFSLIDLEHERKKLVGVLTKASFSSFGDNKPLTRDEVKDLKTPFNIIVGGIIWRVANPELSDYIENNASDSDEPVCLSWEILFSQFNLIEINASKKNFEDGTIITDEQEINKLQKFLRAEGGKGILDNGKKLGRIPIGDLILAGAALTATPAADVPPIQIVPSDSKVKESNSNADFKGFSDTSTQEAYSKDKAEQIKNKPVQKDVQELVKNETKSNDTDKKIKEQPVEQNNTPKVDPVVNKDLLPKTRDFRFGKCPNCGNVSDYNSFIKTWDSSLGVISCDSCSKKSLSTSWEFNEVNIWKPEDSAENKAENKKHQIIANNDNKIINDENKCVKKDNQIMKISSIKDITDENLKEAKASDITEALSSEIKKISDKYEADKAEKENLAKESNKKFEETNAALENTKKELEQLKANLNKINEENAKAAKLQAFSSRMNTLDEKFDLNDKERAILGEKVKNLDKDEDFTKFLDETEILLAAKKKTKKDMKPTKENPDPDDDGDDDTTEEGDTDHDFKGKDKKDKKESKASDENIVDEAINNGEKKEVALANVTAGSGPTLSEKMKNAFGMDNWFVENKKKNRV